MQSREAKVTQVNGYYQIASNSQFAYTQAGLPVIEKDAGALR